MTPSPSPAAPCHAVGACSRRCQRRCSSPRRRRRRRHRAPWVTSQGRRWAHALSRSRPRTPPSLELYLQQTSSHRDSLRPFVADLRSPQATAVPPTPSTHPAPMARDLRRHALQRLAALASASSATSFDRSDLDRLCRAVPNRQGLGSVANGHEALPSKPEVGRVPMVVRPHQPSPRCVGLLRSWLTVSMLPP